MLSSIISMLFPAKRGQTEENPLPLKAVPGLTTLLDVALFRSVEGQLTGTIASSHSLLACWLDIKREARTLLQLYKEKKYVYNIDGSTSPCETFGWQCLESACNAIERLSTDRLAAAANLSDAYESTKASAVSNTSHHSGSNNLFYSSQGSNVTGVGLQGIRNGILESKEKCETGRRQPTIQRRKDCWESPRLYCPDFVWADDVYFACQKWIRNLDKHPLVQISYYIKHRNDSSLINPTSLLTNTSPQGNTGSKSTKGAGSKSRTSSRNSNNTGSDHPPRSQQQRRRRKQEQEDKERPPQWKSLPKVTESGTELESQVLILVKLVQHDLPLRLYQFKAAMEAEAVVTKRLYLVKCEYRAPFRAFLEAHQNLLRAPPMELVDCYLNEQKDNRNNKNSINVTAVAFSNEESSSSPEDIKAELQALLNTPELIELLSLEMEAEKLELDMGKAIFPFSELARTIAHKRVSLDGVPGVVEVHEIPSLRETVRRLEYMLCRTVGSETSTGIRALFLDLLMVPRDDELCTKGSPIFDALYYRTSTTLEERIVQFLSELTILSNLVKTTISQKALSPSTTYPALNIDISLSVSKGCTEHYDPELLNCQLLDWFAIVDRQHLLHENQKELPEEMRRAEMKLSIAGASHLSLKKIKEQLEMLEGIKKERLDILEEMVEEVCLREMNLYVSLTPPGPQQVLELKETQSAPGLFGIPLELAGEILPIG
mmetsp:Transcript_47954/g.53684  ORF Transcript_47954/g.53684 Transcript_47954/m.53684 type:complete len:716 (+) Transcript_47954:151-2298(+)|eukprot:CAMPEP_0170796342 /NCGR_PEP_ID=MMETSP0733-20121128/24777_1 /TAXON_ID=186038 /ORGANISM="Fragilariopsis kerguelensis, Strain L26-C5" /LENGTH=715 /DNA_ID=CAMNT_0011146633 /DNA_START=942 /DNA_END=3089 /DNA_ORIENTATION=+